ncbi:MAG: hypothetical protein Q9213_000059 [Squamulea squamosa]
MPVAPYPRDIALPQMQDPPTHITSSMFGCTLDIVANPVPFSSLDSDLVGLDFQTTHTTLPWPGQIDNHGSLDLPCNVFPISVRTQLLTDHPDGDAYVNQPNLQNIKVEGGYFSVSSPKDEVTLDLPSSSTVDSLVQTIQLKSERPPPRLSSRSFWDPESLRSDPEPKAPQTEQHQYNHNCRRARKLHRCSIASCTKTFHQKTHLEIHIRAHSGYKPFVRSDQSTASDHTDTAVCSSARRPHVVKDSRSLET